MAAVATQACDVVWCRGEAATGCVYIQIDTKLILQILRDGEELKSEYASILKICQVSASSLDGRLSASF